MKVWFIIKNLLFYEITPFHRCKISGFFFKVDLDLGNYERFLDITLTRDNNITTGKIYQVHCLSVFAHLHVYRVMPAAIPLPRFTSSLDILTVSD